MEEEEKCVSGKAAKIAFPPIQKMLSGSKLDAYGQGDRSARKSMGSDYKFPINCTKGDFFGNKAATMTMSPLHADAAASTSHGGFDKQIQARDLKKR